MAAQYPNNVVTKKGLNAIAESVATKQGLIFTKVLVGDGNMPSTNISDLTSIVSKKMELPITSYNNEGNGQFLVRAALSNASLDVGFFPREVALYAKVGESGEEVLYSYTNGENNVGYIPDKTTPIESEVYNIRTVIGNATNVIAKLSDDTFVTVLDLADHNNSTDSHTPLLNKWINSSFTKFKDAVLEVLDCKFKLDSNGYVRLGFLGGFTIQWGWGQNSAYYPIAFTKYSTALPVHKGTNGYVNAVISYDSDLTKIVPIFAGAQNDGIFHYIAVGA